MKKKLTVARIQDRTEALGPGTRAVIWFHGCTFDCPGCIAAEMNQSSVFAEFLPQELADRTCQIEDIEGITISGGDPFDQPLELLEQFVRIVKATERLTIMGYTGRTLEQLSRGKLRDQHQRILQHIDILVDGLYVEALNDGGIWRGSSNQQIHFLTPRYKHLGEFVAQSHDRRIEVSIVEAHKVEITGIPPKLFMKRLHEELRAKGLSLEFNHDIEESNERNSQSLHKA